MDDSGAPTTPQPTPSSIAFVVMVQTMVSSPPSSSPPLNPTPSVVAVANVVSLQYRSTPAPPSARRLATSPIIGYHRPPSVPPPTAFRYRLQPLLIVEYVSCPFFPFYLVCTLPISINIPPKHLLLRIPNR